MIFNKKIIVIIFLLSSLFFKMETSHGEDFDPTIFKNLDDSLYTAIDEVIKDGPAFVAGLKAGDVILEIDYKKIYSNKDISYEIQNSKSQTINIKVSRKNKIIDFKVTPKTNSENYKLIGIYTGNKCAAPRDLVNKSSLIYDQVYLECMHHFELEKYNYLKKLKKTSPNYEILYPYYIKYKIKAAKNMGNAYFRN